MKRFTATACVFLAAGCWGIPNGRAELEWAQKTLDLHADTKSTVIEGRFRFTNTGTTPVDIRQIQTSCGCTTAALEQRHYTPGQTGEIVARFSVGERTGLQTKTIAVSTSDKPLPTSLTLVVHIPELVHVLPAFVTWQQWEPDEAKMIRVESAQAAVPLAEVSVQSSNPAVPATLQATSDPGKYQIRVRPETTDRPLFTTLTIQCRVGTETKNFRAFASVRQPLPTTIPSPAKFPPTKPPAALVPPAADDSLVPPG